MAFVGKPLVTFKSNAGGAAPAPEEPTKAAEAPAQQAPSPSAPTSPSSDASKIQTTPAVRRIAKENNIDLQLVQPTGPQGRILKEDVLRFLKGGSVPEISAAPVTTPKSSPSTVPVSPTPLPRAAPIPIATQQDR